MFLVLEGRRPTAIIWPHLAGFPSKHPSMVEGVGAGQMLEHVVVWSKTWRGEDRTEDGVRGVVEGVAGHQGTTMDVSGQDELDFADPLLDCLSLRLRPFIVLLEVVGEIPVQVEPSRIVPAIEMYCTCNTELDCTCPGRPDRSPRSPPRSRPGSCWA